MNSTFELDDDSYCRPRDAPSSFGKVSALRDTIAISFGAGRRS
jgi:hypothetical protein